VYYFNNATAPNSGQQYGPFNIGTISKLFRVRVRGAVVYQPQAFTSGDFLVDPVTWGFQWGIAGYSPLNLPGDADSQYFLYAEQKTIDEVSVVWAPSTDTAAVGVGSRLSLDWAGQLFIGEDTDFYFTTAQAFSFGVTWGITGAIEVIHT
jgi:hypothetical protein